MRLLGLFFVLIVAIVILIRSTLQGAFEKKNYLSVYLRIFLNHMQLLILTASFDFQWPNAVKEMFKSAAPVAEASTQFISFDCFIDSRESNDDTDTLRLFYSKLVMLAILPFLIVAFAFLTWLCIFKVNSRSKEKSEIHYIEGNQNDHTQVDIKKNYERSLSETQKLMGRVVATIIIMLFLAHPSIT